MATKRTPLRRSGRPRLTPAMRAKAERLLVLKEAHVEAIRNASPRTQKFYTDGRHEELIELASEVDQALGIKPWMDDLAILRDALGVK